MTVLDDIIKEWEKDAKIDPTDISGEILKTPSLFAKYIAILTSWKQKRTTTKIKLNEIRQLKSRYYRGELSVEDVKRLFGTDVEQYQGVKPLKAELEAMLAADSDVNEVQTKLEMIDNIIYVVEQILAVIKNRDFTLGTYTKYQMFLAGSK